ncbi:MAG TPA: sigma 54-interacting transcriptional regulator [Candidatus Binatia bacterium]
MKNILVLDDSDAVRETVALLLEEEFAVLKRAWSPEDFHVTDVDRDVELLIVGLASTAAAKPGKFLNVAAARGLAVLFLAETRAIANAIGIRENVGCLVKPFNPYELKAEVSRLLAPPPVSKVRGHTFPTLGERRYIEFPYVDRVVATLIERYGTARLPVLISGERGCGQERVARSMHSFTGPEGPRFVLTSGDLTQEMLQRCRLQLEILRERSDGTVTVLIENLDALSVSGQAILRDFVENDLTGFKDYRIVATAKSDLLQKVYSGEFPEMLYYQLALLNLILRPLRDRRDEIPAIAAATARFYGEELDLDEVSFSPAALERLNQYLWFGNVEELETVVARTLAVHRKSRIEASDLMFDFNAAKAVVQLPAMAATPATRRAEAEVSNGAAHHSVSGGANANGHRTESAPGPFADLRVLIHELAHELKNPMVTIKTFAQLLTDRYQDESFRARFQGVVDGDIERIDELLEVMIEFANFAQPRKITIPLADQVNAVLGEISGESIDRQVRFGWKRNDAAIKIIVDESQLQYVLKNALVAVLSQTKMASEIELSLEKPNRLVIGFSREGGRVASITQLFSAPAAESDEAVLPLRILLARYLLERNGGAISMKHADSDRETLEMEFPIA